MNDPDHTKAYKPEQPPASDEIVDDVSSQSVHPSNATLLQLATKGLDESRTENVQKHLTSCAQCTMRMNQLYQSFGSFVDGLSSTHSPHDDQTSAASPPDETVDHLTPSVDTASKSTTPTFGDYELISEIARGGMGVVYKARQKSLNRIVALKMIKSGEFANQEQVDRFYKEAEAAANLDHPGIVPVYEVGEVGGQHYFTMGFVDGDSLADRLRDGPLPPKEAARYTKSIAVAVAYAHSEGVIHRDLKPGNVLITNGGQLRITDFGLAKRVEEDSELTATGQVLGTPAYMPPEQAEGKLAEIGPAADIYSIGASLYCMLVGRPPFQAANLIENLRQVIHTEPVSLKVQNPAIPSDLETLCLKCLEKKPSSRYSSSQELVDELNCFLNGEPIQARPVGRFERALRWCKRKPAQAIAAAAVVLLAIGGPVLWIQLWLSNRNAAISRVDTLLNAAPATVPLLLSDLDEDFNTVRSRLEQLDARDLEADQRLRVSLALLPWDGTQLEYLKQLITSCSYEELAITLDRVKQHNGQPIASGLWEKFRSQDVTSEERFRAGLALATLDPGSDRWSQADHEFLVDRLLGSNTPNQQAIRNSLSPIADTLIPQIQFDFQDPNSNNTIKQAAANAIVDFAGDDGGTLTEFAIAGTAKQFSILYPEVARHAATDVTIIDHLITVTKLHPVKDSNESERIALGKQRAGAAICLLRLGNVDAALEVLSVEEDPESLTQFVHGCKDRGVKVTEVLDMLSRAESVTERYGLLLTLGEFSVDAVPADIRITWVDHIMGLYANDPSSGIHGASGWLLRRWGLNKDAKAIEEREVPYSQDREWFTLKINVAGPLDFESYSYFTFVVLPAGNYEIGSPDYERDGDSSDETTRGVKISRSFAVLDREVTRGEVVAVTEFRGFSNDSGWREDPLGASAGMNWYLAVKFCRSLTSRRGFSEQDQVYADPSQLDRDKYPVDQSARFSFDRGVPLNWPVDFDKTGFRLPSAAEWEIACRAGIVTTFGFGSDRRMLDQYAWYQDSSANQGHRPKLLRPNLRGLFDMHGNVVEWCHDWSGGNTVDVLTDPIGPSEGSLRVLRGGSWNDNATYGRTARRFYYQPAIAVNSFGFRVVLSLGLSSSHRD